MKKLVVPVLIFLLLVGLAACQLAPTPVPLPPTSMPRITRTPVPPAPTATPTITPIPPLNSPNGPPLKSIHMFTVKDGWGLIDDSLLVTHDSGVSWFSVPLPDGKIDPLTSVKFLSATEAYLLLPASDGQTGLLYYTTNGGGTWVITPAPFARGQLDIRDGQLHLLQTNNTDLDSMPVNIYTSVDSGTTWGKIFPGDNQDPQFKIPEAGLKTGISFISIDLAWIGLVSQPQEIVLYQTGDGAKSWVRQEIPAPQNITSLTTTVFPPVFFAKDWANGLLPVEFSSADTGNKNLVFYFTVDAGATWTPGEAITDGSVYTFIDANTGWAWGKRGLYFTSDGAHTWTLLPVAFSRSENVTGINFVDPKNGWLITVGQKSRVRLYRSTDGGATWTLANP